MSTTDEEITAVSNIENAKISDGTSTAGEHNKDVLNTMESEEQLQNVESLGKNDTEAESYDNREDELVNDSNQEDHCAVTPKKKLKIIESYTEEADAKGLKEELILF
ncbi:unnamed protein product [Adineta ricciae]|uniref:Uncharacterized protein n=1 Tax=Adineta ricciae TaxID=249248 RepID=A0A815CAM2_ADIRI|nr:unnamed protein product [Adineta ricciae]CAF1280926.1 unnamed protein product [Adineta ricciae]